MPCTALPRLPAFLSASMFVPARIATSARVTSGTMSSGSPRMPESATIVSTPSARTRSRRYATSGPFVSRVPIKRTVGISSERHVVLLDLFQPEIPELHLHRRADVNLQAQQPSHRSAGNVVIEKESRDVAVQ